MNVKEASRKFNLDEKGVRKRCSDHMVRGVYKEKGKIVIPDETTIIPSKIDIQNFLFQILKYKNNNSIAISRTLCPGEKELHELCKYLYMRGFVGEFNFTNNIQYLFNNIKLTDDGLAFVFGRLYEKISSERYSKLNVNPTANFSFINVNANF